MSYNFCIQNCFYITFCHKEVFVRRKSSKIKCNRKYFWVIRHYFRNSVWMMMDINKYLLKILIFENNFD